MKDDKVYVVQTLDALAKIEAFTDGVTFDAFNENQEKQSAVILQLAIIGEISKRFSDDFKNRVDLPWREIAGFRDMAIHDYLSLDLERVWNTVKDDIPRLKNTLTAHTS